MKRASGFVSVNEPITRRSQVRARRKEPSQQVRLSRSCFQKEALRAADKSYDSSHGGVVILHLSHHLYLLFGSFCSKKNVRRHLVFITESTTFCFNSNHHGQIQFFKIKFLKKTMKRTRLVLLWEMVFVGVRTV